MKCLIIQSNGEHRGQDGWTPNWYLRECFGLQHAFITNGISADIWGYGHPNFSNTKDFNKYDVIFCAEGYRTKWVPDLSKYKHAIKIQWIIDLHCQRERYRSISRWSDIILHSTRSLINGYKSEFPTKRHIWFPNAVDDRYFANRNLVRDIDIAFVGTKVIGGGCKSGGDRRKSFIERLERDVGLNYKFATGEDMLKMISRTKVNFNMSISCDVNYRNFETIALGSCLLTNRNDELCDLGFVDGDNCVMYENYDDAVNKIRTLVGGSWERIAQNGNVLSHSHTYSQRVRKLIDEI